MMEGWRGLVGTGGFMCWALAWRSPWATVCVWRAAASIVVGQP
jgi:hypothetical protein